MAWIDSGDTYLDLTMDLVDGYIPDKKTLTLLVNRWPTFPFKGTPEWKKWKNDSIVQELGDAIRSSFCTSQKAPDVRSSQYCEAWLLEPKEAYGHEFELKSRSPAMRRRRLIITLHYDCKIGKECLNNLLQQIQFEIIPKEQYRNYGALQKTANYLFDTVSTPFLAPCIIAEKELEKCGYHCAAFGR